MALFPPVLGTYINNLPKMNIGQQWTNPGDILSLLLLIGGDVIRKAIAQLVGHRVKIPGFQARIPVTPVAFSFGWVAFAVSNLLSAAGNRPLMPEPEDSSMLINCSNGFARNNASWILSRLIHDHEVKNRIDARSKKEGGREESIRIDIFDLKAADEPKVDAEKSELLAAKPESDVVKQHLDRVWWFGWVTILVQIGIATVPWALWGGWGSMAVTLFGNIFAFFHCFLPQWRNEKWATRKLSSPKTVSLTRGNGYHHIMVIKCPKDSWDLEALASGFAMPCPETRWASLVLATLWICLLISVSGLKEHAWFLVAIGGFGMLQNIYAAGMSRDSATAGLYLTRSVTIMGERGKVQDDDSSDIEANVVIQDPKGGIPEWLQPAEPKANGFRYGIGVQGALIELEKCVTSAGEAHVPIFFPSGLDPCEDRARDNIHKKFWKRAYVAREDRKEADKKRMVEANKKRKMDLQ